VRGGLNPWPYAPPGGVSHGLWQALAPLPWHDRPGLGHEPRSNVRVLPPGEGEIMSENAPEDLAVAPEPEVPEPSVPEPPPLTAPKADHVDFAVEALGIDPAEAAGMTKADIAEAAAAAPDVTGDEPPRDEFTTAAEVPANHHVRLGDVLGATANFFARNPALEKALMTELAAAFKALERVLYLGSRPSAHPGGLSTGRSSPAGKVREPRLTTHSAVSRFQP
jgi:hypothetical protein